VSKAFTKDEAWEEPIIPPRAPVLAGVELCRAARVWPLRAEIRRARSRAPRLEGDRSDEAEYRRRLAIVTGRTSEFAARIASAALSFPPTSRSNALRR
jgi:hypothetical protein